MHGRTLRRLSLVTLTLGLILPASPARSQPASRGGPSELEVLRTQVENLLDEAEKETDLELRRQLYEQALRSAQALTHRAPTWGHAWLLLGETHLGLGEDQTAAEDLTKAGHFSPLDPVPDVLRGTAFLRLQDPDRAFQALSEGLRKRPDPELAARAHHLVGTALQMQHRYTDASQAFRRAGDDERAEALDRYRAFSPSEAILERDPKTCRRKLQLTLEVVKLSGDVAGTPEGERLEEELAELQERCGDEPPSD